MCILPIYTIHAVTVLTTFITKSTSKITALRIASRCHISLFAEQREKWRLAADLRTNMRVCVCILPIYNPRSDRSDHIYREIHVENHSSANSRKKNYGRKKTTSLKVQQFFSVNFLFNFHCESAWNCPWTCLISFHVEMYEPCVCSYSRRSNGVRWRRRRWPTPSTYTPTWPTYVRPRRPSGTSWWSSHWRLRWGAADPRRARNWPSLRISPGSMTSLYR